jgi:Phage integrase, N-terminal SAM-like domain
VRAFTQDFPFIQDVKRKAVQQWVNRQAKGGKKAATISRSLSELRGYWSYLTSVEAVPEDSLPLEKLSVPRPSNKDNGGEEVRQPFTAKEVMSLLNAAVEREDSQLADLIRLGMWTGARLEELSALKVKDVNPVYFEVKDAKSAAGRRQIPIHSKLKTTMRRLITVPPSPCVAISAPLGVTYPAPACSEALERNCSCIWAMVLEQAGARIATPNLINSAPAAGSGEVGKSSIYAVGTVPPSITYSVPVMARARAETRKAMRSATSVGFAGRPSGIPPSDFMMICLPPS